ncbi:hypothetical protein N7456_012665 [Penicillium angulare]|uniref:U6 snRNA phosphodiesterase n=1 Tax=Penicillium angulare TaxID=116970 RepID=A0A9W9EJZ3_9EURO|nr:hypothetical protein N7456_012665 [Penicillium angulare]
MSLVQYSDSGSDSDSDAELPPPKRPRHIIQPISDLPPLPPTFHDLYASSTRVSVQDDPTLHGGRKRVTPHVEGNWPTHLYLEWYPSKEELPLLKNLIPSQSKDRAKNQVRIHSLLHSDLGAQLPLHISLSRSVVLRTEQRTLFMDSVQKAVEGSRIPPFNVIPDRLMWAPNHDRTRWFLVLHVQRPKENTLNALLWSSNRALARVGQPPLYASSVDDASHQQDYSDNFHISIAWTLTEPRAENTQYLTNIDLDPLQDLHIQFDCLKVKIGNNVTSIPLPMNM